MDWPRWSGVADPSKDETSRITDIESGWRIVQLPDVVRLIIVKCIDFVGFREPVETYDGVSHLIDVHCSSLLKTASLSRLTSCHVGQQVLDRNRHAASLLEA